MALPNIATPEFKTSIPSTGEEIVYRPFLVKEEKLLLMAMEGNDESEITSAVMKILDNCILSDVDMNTLATFDIEYLFLKLRSKSVGEVIELKVAHVIETDCKHTTDVNVNVDDITVVGEISDGKIMLTDDVGVKMSYPTLGQINNLALTNTEDLFKLIISCIDFIFDADDVYNEFKEDELMSWLETLNQSQFKKISDFFENMPKLSTTVDWTCEKCGEKDSIKIEGLQSFFI
jgi:hypothetical protein